MKLSIVIPMYNEEPFIAEVLDRVVSVPLDGVEKEIVVVDDGSTDASLTIAQQFAAGRAGVCVHAAPINLGKGAAVRIGLRHATGDIVLVQDADLELDPAEYPRLLAPLQANGTKVVYGSRFKHRPAGVSGLYLWGNRLLVWVTNVLYGARLTDMETCYKLLAAEVVEKLRLRCVGFDIEPEITAKVLKAGYRIVEVPISYAPRSSEEGKKLSWRDGLDALYTLFKCRFLE
jgi:glycosyltransferase involved in cell wall biosynthesis